MRLIDADALIESLDKDGVMTTVGYAVVVGIVKSAPTIDAFPVVRCRECKFNCNFPEIPLCRYVNYPNFERNGDGYCSMGQRREDGLYESLKRGLEEAIAYENGEIECRTETREDGGA